MLQRGLKVGEVTYDELPKEMLMTVIPESDKDFVVKTVLGAAKTSETVAAAVWRCFSVCCTVVCSSCGSAATESS